VYSSGYFRTIDGATTTPSYTFSGDTNTGMYRISDDVLGFTAGGAERLRIAIAAITSVEPISITDSTSSTTASTGALIVTGGIGTGENINATGNITATGDVTGDHIIAGLGTVSAPSIYFGADSNSGFFRPSADNVQIVSNATAVASATDSRFRALLTDNATSRTTGALQSAGGLGVQLDIYNRYQYAQDGSAATPAYSFANDTTMGIQRYGADTMSLVISGGDAVLLTATQLDVTYTTSATGVNNGAIRSRGGISAAENVIFGGIARSGDGTASGPAYAFVSDVNTGMYLPSADHLAFVSNGTERAAVTDNSLVLNGGFRIKKETSASTSFTPTTANCCYELTAGSNVTVTLPDTSTEAGNNGRLYIFIKTSSTASGDVTINRSGTDTIDGSLTSVDLTDQFDRIMLVSSGATGRWYTM
jgi:hypothetical protein